MALTLTEYTMLLELLEYAMSNSSSDDVRRAIALRVERLAPSYVKSPERCKLARWQSLG